jgi:hypothetical protein
VVVEISSHLSSGVVAMTFSAVVNPYQDRYAASLVGEPEISAVGGTREAAIAALRTEVAHRVGRGELIALEIEPIAVTDLAGKYRDDPTLDSICADAYRERDAESRPCPFSTPTF